MARVGRLARRGFSAYRRTVRDATPNARRYLLGMAIQSAGIGMVATVFALYVNANGLPTTVVGNVEGALALAAGITCLLVPPLVASVGYRALLIGSAVAYGLARAGQAAVPAAGAIVALGLLYGLGDGVLRSVGVAFLAESSKPSERTMLFTADFALRVAAQVVGSATGGLVAALLSRGMPSAQAYQWTLALAGVAILASVIPFFGIRDRRRPRGRVWAQYVRSARAFRSWDRLVRLAVPEAIIAFGAGLIIPFVPLFLSGRHQASVAQIGFILGASAAVMAVATLATPLLARRFGLVGTMVLTELTSLPFLIGIPLAGSLSVVAVLVIARTALMNMSWPIYNRLAVEGIPDEDKPFVVGWMSVAWSIAWLGGSVIGGHLNSVSYTAPYFYTALLYGAGAGVTWLLLRGIKTEEAPVPSVPFEEGTA